jgi:uncharacterized protein
MVIKELAHQNNTMSYFSKLFIKTPFISLQSHMSKVESCMTLLREVMQGLKSESLEVLQEKAKKIVEFEYEADLIKNEIRKNLPRSVLFLVDRSQFLELVTLQDNLADAAEDIANLITVKQLTIDQKHHQFLMDLLDKNLESFELVKELILCLEQLVESSFGGKVAQKVKAKVDLLALKEHEADLAKHNLLKTIFERGEKLSAPDFYIWMRLIDDIQGISHFCEKIAIRMGMMLVLKT